MHWDQLATDNIGKLVRVGSSGSSGFFMPAAKPCQTHQYSSLELVKMVADHMGTLRTAGMGLNLGTAERLGTLVGGETDFSDL